MKKLEYEGDLNKDLKRIESKYILYDKKALRLTYVLFAVSCILTGCAIFTCGVSLELFLFLFNIFITGQFIGVNFLFQKWQLEIWNADVRVNDLVVELEENDVLVNDLEVRNTVLIGKKENVSDLMISDDKEKINETKNLIKYWSFLDRNDKIQILKFVKSIIIEMGETQIREEVFLLDDSDKDSLDDVLKKCLSK